MRVVRLTAIIFILGITAPAQESKTQTRPRDGDYLIRNYFRSEVNEISSQWLDGVKTLEDWKTRREELRRQLLEMLGLWPMPPRTDLKPTITGRIEQDELVVEKLHFQSMPGLYVTANLYLPRAIKAPLPAVLYVCGHGNIKKEGVSYGSKTFYQHHPAWFARHGYASLVIDTLQLAEIEGIHHGTNRFGMWWWIARGYTPAGVETWNSIRALDYLQSRPEIDGERIGVTGRSGGGAYSWYLAAVDERVKAAVPVAGITDLQNHVADDAIEGHCDCMYMVNTYRWDFPLVAALVAPRPLLLANSDKDRIFPLDGVQRIHGKVRQIYELYGAKERLGLLITEGPHSDTQDLQVPAFRWMNRWLKQDDPVVEKAAAKFFEPESLKVFRELPADHQNTQIHETFVPAASEPPLPADLKSWETLQQQWTEQLLAKSFAGWPEKSSVKVRQLTELTPQGVRLAVYEFQSQLEVPLRLWVLQSTERQKPKRLSLTILDESNWQDWLESGPDSQSLSKLKPHLEDQAVVAAVAPRGIGPTAWTPEADKHIRRRFVLLGQTLDGMRLWDVRQAIATIRQLPGIRELPLQVKAEGSTCGLAVYASLFEPGIAELALVNPTTSHREGPIFLNVQKIFDLPQAMALSMMKTRVVLENTDPKAWSWPRRLAQKFNLNASRLQINGE